MSRYAPFDEMVPSSYCLTKITSTKSRGAMIPIAAEGVTVRQIEMSCTRVGDKGMYLNKAQAKMDITMYTFKAARGKVFILKHVCGFVLLAQI